MGSTIIVDYEAGNLRSVLRACAEVHLPAEISADPRRVANADRIIFPGVGHASTAMATLRRTGLDAALRFAWDQGTPILGICLGLQIVLESSEEGNATMLAFVEGVVRRFKLQGRDLKIPHMGWNRVRLQRPHPVFVGLDSDDEFYFVHSYYAQPANDCQVIATTWYEQDFCCVLGCENYIGVQFHMEKSGRAGLELIARFGNWDGRWVPASPVEAVC